MGDIPFNVLSNESITQQNTLDQVAAMINSAGYNRGQRRRLEKALSKTNKLSQKCQKKLGENIYKEYQAAVDQNCVHFFSILALTLIEDYRWKEDDTHDQVSSMLERVGKKIDKYAAQGYTTQDLAQLVEKETGIVLVPDEH